MRMHFLRNATFVLQVGQHHILVDPMLGPPGSLMSFTFVRKPHRNPLVQRGLNNAIVSADWRQPTANSSSSRQSPVGSHPNRHAISAALY